MLKEECGVFGIIGIKDAPKMAHLGLYALQHRGQESAGIVSSEIDKFYIVKGEGLISEVFNTENIAYLKGDSAIGHVRYSTTGSPHINNIQPIYSKTNKGKIAIAHNGNLTNAYSIYKKLKAEGALFQSTIDSEIILHLIARSKKKTMQEAIQETLNQIQGAYSLVFLGDGYLLAARDPWGFRPLVLGHLNGAYVVASETNAFDLIGATYIREIEPGEIIYIEKNKDIISFSITPKIKVKTSFCIFEHIYFARPDSIIFGDSVHLVRKEFGKVLAREFPVEADLVMSIPDSGNSAALGYAEESGIPFEFGMTRNHYVGRTFIDPRQKNRNFKVKIKLNPIKSVLKNKRVVIVDDSIVRGTTSKRRVSAIREAGAKEVHVRISSPPITSSCYFGIDTPKRENLIAANKSLNEIKRYINADSLGYLSVNGMLTAIKAHPKENFCTSCFTGNYPLKVIKKGKYAIEGKGLKLYAKKR